MKASYLLPSYWEDSNGRVVCSQHLGNYLRCALEAEPEAVEVHTPLGVHFRMTDAEVTEFAEQIRDLCGESLSICEDCRGGW